jgi:uncharacterized RDD family membrane protein YckC
MPAGVVTRSLAAAVDGLVAGAIELGLWGGYAALVFLLDPHHFTFPSPPVLSFVGLFGVVAFVYLSAAWAMSGRTLGGQLLGLRVQSSDGGRPAWLTSMARAALYIVFPIGLFWSAVSARNRSVQDMLLRTSVVYDWGHRPPQSPPTG